jgi:hypothetical protein
VKINRLLDKSKISDSNPEHLASNGPEIILLDNKIQELIDVIGTCRLESHHAKQYEQKIAKAFQKSVSVARQLAPYQSLDQDNNLSREELLEGLEKLLSETTIDSKMTRSYLHRNTAQKIVMFILSILLIALGFAMIIMPAPPSFEIFTVFHINKNDGVTIMDLVSLLVIFGGVLMFILNFNKK